MYWRTCCVLLGALLVLHVLPSQSRTFSIRFAYIRNPLNRAAVLHTMLISYILNLRQSHPPRNGQVTLLAACKAPSEQLCCIWCLAHLAPCNCHLHPDASQATTSRVDSVSHLLVGKSRSCQSSCQGQLDLRVVC